ncbi:MAG: hypothetical protein LC720_09180 [Actinobacteria bacterium]|nr:hypothetical protein [Actinomycetota bacterium]
MSSLHTSGDGRSGRAGPATPAARWRSALGLVVVGLTAVSGGPATTLAAGPKQTVFTGRIGAATGGYAKLRGSVRIVVRSHPASTGAGFTLTLSAASCPTRPVRTRTRCASLSGRVTGTATARPRRPADVGTTVALTGTGSVSPLGRVFATGTATGPGFIARGRLGLTLSLRTSAGRLTIVAQGPLVPGFTPPL